MLRSKKFFNVLFFFEFLNLLLAASASDDINSTSIIFYYGPNVENNERFKLNRIPDIVNSLHFKIENPTTLFIHGYLENQAAGSPPVVRDAYLNRTDINFLTLDWAKAAGGNYVLNAIPNAKKLGPILAKLLIKLIENGLNLHTFHIVGHSLGGQLAGIVGRKVQLFSDENIKIQRITGLDPASVGYYILRKQISASDAVFVDIIHTDAFGYGMPYSTGTVDFWPNRGTSLQPGCPKRNHLLLTDNDLCSHRASWRYWAESISRKYNIQFLANNDDRLQPVIMGIDCPQNLKGNFYLRTNGSPPYARGSQGLVDWGSPDSFGFKITEISNIIV